MKTHPGVMLPAVLLAAGCINEPARMGDEAPLDSAIRVSLTETLPDRALVLNARTSREYPCFNYVIETSFKKLAGGFEIAYSGVHLPGEICLTAPGPARSESGLGTLARGQYGLQMNTPDGVAKLKVDVQDGSYGILGNPGPAIRFEEIELRRVPDGTIWGVFGYAVPETETKVDATLAEMKELGASPVRLPAGTYSVRFPSFYSGDRFRVSPAGALLREDSGYYFTRAFVFHYGGDRNELRDLVVRVGAENGDALHLRVFSSQGDVFLSWYPRP